MHLYFVRHGETELNRQGAYYGAYDVPLTTRGQGQAKNVGKALKDIHFDAIYVSDKCRTQETARLMLLENAGPACRLKVMPELAEINFGCFEGLTNRQVQERFPKLYERWCADWLDTVLDGGESFSMFFDRVRRAFEQILAGHTSAEDEENVLICAHNGTLRVIFAVMCDLAPLGTWHFNFEQDTYSLADYEWGNFTIRKINAGSGIR